MPGPLDHRDGVLRRVTGFPQWDGYPLRAALAERTGLPVALDKDTNAAALALALAPGGAGGGDFAYLHLGTGLGAGLVLGGRVHRGARTGAGEFGHQTLQLDGPLCGCGGRGCVEALCLAAEARGDRPEAARILGAGAANLVGLLDIDRVVLGGRTVAADEDAYVRGVRAVIEERASGAVRARASRSRWPGAATARWRRARPNWCWRLCSGGWGRGVGRAATVRERRGGHVSVGERRCRSRGGTGGAVPIPWRYGWGGARPVPVREGSVSDVSVREGRVGAGGACQPRAGSGRGFGAGGALQSGDLISHVGMSTL